MKSVKDILFNGSLAAARRLNAGKVYGKFNAMRSFTISGSINARIKRVALRNTVQTERSKESKKNGRVI